MHPLSAILFVDDDPATNHLNERLTRKLAVAEQYLTASSGPEALRHLRSLAEQPLPGGVLVLLDVGMPGMDGLAFAAAVQQLPLPVRQATKLIMHTLHMTAEQLHEVEQLPIQGLVSKPLTEAKLTTILQLHFGYGGQVSIPARPDEA